MRAFGLVVSLVLVLFALAYISVQIRVPVPTITLLTGTLVILVVGCSIYIALGARTRLLKYLVIAAVVIGFVPALIASAVVSSRVVNDWRLSAFARRIVAHPPPLARANLERARVGVLTGNGNHCDFIVDVSVTGVAAERQVIEHYESLPVERAIPGESSEVQVRAVRNPDGRILVTVTDAPNDAAFDLRCI